jgi:glycosyltransferase involved in cell wall biosynthesis
MRILVVNYEYPPLGGGGGVLSRILVAELARNHEVTVLTSRGPGLPAESFDDGAHVIRVPVIGRRDLATASMPSLMSFVPSARRAGRALVARSPLDMVHTFFAVPSGPAGAAIAKRAGVPHVLTVIGADVYDPTRAVSPGQFGPLSSAVGRIVRGATGVTAISRDIAQRAKRLSGRHDISVVSCAIPRPALPRADRAALGRQPGDFVVVTIARLVARKGIDVLIHAVGRAGPPVRLEVVGDGPQRERLEALAADVAPGRVTFAGGLASNEKGLRLVSADAFALVSQHEGFGLVYLEAMHAGLPIVAGDEGGQTDFLRDGHNALLVRPGDASGLAAALRRLAADRELRSRLGNAGRRSVESMTPATMAAGYLDAYDRART